MSTRSDLQRLTNDRTPFERDKSDDIPPLIKVSLDAAIVDCHWPVFFRQVLTSSHDAQKRIEQCKQTVVAIAKKRKNYLDEIKSVESAADRRHSLLSLQ